MIDLPPPVPAIEFSLASRGISKGLAQTKGVQGLVRGEVAFGSIYFGAYAKNVSSSSSDGEAAALVGLRTKAAGFDVAGSAGWKMAIDPEAGSDANALEASASVSRRFGRVAPRISIVWSPDDLGSTEQTAFMEAGAGYRLTNTLSASAAIGRRERGGGPDYTAWNGGLSWSPKKQFTLDVRYYDTNRNIDRTYKARVVAVGRLKF